MSKERRTVSVDEEVEDYLSRDDVNASGLVNRLVQNHATAGGDERAMLELRREQLQNEVESLEGQLGQKRDQLAEVEERLSQWANETDKIVADAADALDGVPADPENQAIQTWADKAELSPEEFVSRLETERDGEGYT